MDPFVGLIALFPYPFIPNGWFTCDGQVLSVTDYQPLFTLIGNRFGGDGRQTFALPNLPDPAPGMRYFIATVGDLPQRS